MKSPLVTAAVICFYAFFYRRVVAHWHRPVHSVLRRLRLEHRYPVREVEAVGKLAAAGVAQLAFAIALAAGAGIRFDNVLGRGINAPILVAAAALGLAELALTSLVCTVIVELAIFAGPLSRESATREWSSASRAGWMSYFLLTVRAAPAPVAATTICLYVFGEELIFRGVLVNVFASAGAVVAVGIPMVLFVAVQSFGMPSRRAALYPMVGAAVIGLVHGIIFVQVPDIAPLAVAHVTFFLTAIVVTSRRGVLT